MPRLKVFLSHLNLEKELAEILQQAIKRDFIGLVDFFVSSDTTSIPVGEKWLDRLIDQMGTADIDLVLCSPEAVKRPWINFETGAARLRRIPIIPICHSGLTPRQLPVPLSEFESVIASAHDDLLKLYGRIASLLSSSVPSSSLNDLVRDITAFEAVYEKRIAEAAACEVTPATTVIASPRVLCISSEQFIRMGFEDFQFIRKAFPEERVSHQQVLTSAGTRDLLMHEHFDIVHVATYVCPKTGDLVFSDVDLNPGNRICGADDFLTAEAFAALLKRTRASLAVIASCESFELAAALLPVTNVVATRDVIAVAMFAAWVESFYEALPMQPLSEAFDFAVKASRAPMKLYARQDLVVGSGTQRSRSAAN